MAATAPVSSGTVAAVDLAPPRVPFVGGMAAATGTAASGSAAPTAAADGRTHVGDQNAAAAAASVPSR